MKYMLLFQAVSQCILQVIQGLVKNIIAIKSILSIESHILTLKLLTLPPKSIRTPNSPS